MEGIDVVGELEAQGVQHRLHHVFVVHCGTVPQGDTAWCGTSFHTAGQYGDGRQPECGTLMSQRLAMSGQTHQAHSSPGFMHSSCSPTTSQHPQASPTTSQHPECHRFFPPTPRTSLRHVGHCHQMQSNRSSLQSRQQALRPGRGLLLRAAAAAAAQHVWASTQAVLRDLIATPAPTTNPSWARHGAQHLALSTPATSTQHTSTLKHPAPSTPAHQHPYPKHPPSLRAPAAAPRPP